MRKKIFCFLKVYLIIYFFHRISTGFTKTKIFYEKSRNFKPETNFTDILSSIKAKEFINCSINDKQIVNKTYTLCNKPKLSIIIPIYNKEKIIKRTIRSIQNQNFVNYEIILVNDHSSDNTLSTIKNIKKNEPRIKIIQNKKNMGTLYSRCIGTLSSKGKYILPLDHDDMYLYKYAFDDIYKEINYNNLDMIKFNGIETENLRAFFKDRINNVKFAFNRDYNIIINQPNLSYYPTIRLNDIGNNFAVDLFLWLKCIKTGLYKKAILSLNKDMYSIHITSHEDDIMSFIIFQLAQTFKYIKKYCVLHFEYSTSANKLTTDENRVIANIYYLDIVFKFSKSTRKGKEIILGIVINIMKFNSFINVMKSIKYKKYFNDILKKIYSSKYIKVNDKKFIKEKYFNISKKLV